MSASCLLPLMMASMARSSSVLGALSFDVVLAVVVSSTVMDSTLPLASVVSICFFFCICSPKDEAFCCNTSGLLSMLPSAGCLAEAGKNSSFLCLALARQSALGRGEILRGATSFLGSALTKRMIRTNGTRGKRYNTNFTLSLCCLQYPRCARRLSFLPRPHHHQIWLFCFEIWV